MIKTRSFIEPAAQRRINEIHAQLGNAHHAITLIEALLRSFHGDECPGSREQDFYATALKELRTASTYLDRTGSAANSATYYKA